MARKPVQNKPKLITEPHRFLITGYANTNCETKILEALKVYASQLGLDSVRIKKVQDPEREAFVAKTKVKILEEKLLAATTKTPATTTKAINRRRKRWEELNKEFGQA